MPKMPGADRLGYVRPEYNTRVASGDMTAVARGAQQLGAGIANLSGDLNAVANERRQQQGTTEISGANAAYAEDILTADREITSSPDYSTYGKAFEERGAKALQRGASLISDPKYREKWLADKKVDLVNRQQSVLGEAEVKQKEAFRVNLGTAIEKDQNIFTDPATPEPEKQAALARIRDSIGAAETTGLLDPVKAKQWRDTYEAGSILKEAELRVLNDPEFRQSVLSGEGAAGASVVDRIIGVESGGNPTAKNPKSSATGAGQFISSTWVNMIKQYRPDLMEGRTADEVLALRNDPALSREMTQNYANENAQFLKNQGIQATDGNVYLAHFLGPRGAAQLLKANPSAPVETVVGEGVVNANPFLRGKSAADVAAWAAKKMGSSNPLREGIYKDLSPEQRQALYERAGNEQKAYETSLSAQRKAENGAAYDMYRLRLETGDTSLTRQSILNDATIDNGQKASLINSYNEKMKEGIAIAEAMPLFAQGQLGSAVNPYDEKGRKLVDSMYDAISKALPEDRLQMASEDLVRQTGVVPKRVFNSIRAGVESTNRADVASSLDMASRIYSVDPSAIGRMAGGDALQKQVDTFRTFVDDYGFTAEQAAQRVMDAKDPAKIREREAILKTKTVSDAIKGIDAADVGSVFKSGWFSPDVGGALTEEMQRIGVNPQSEAAIVGDFKRYVEDAVIETGGDVEAAKKVAGERFKRVYGASNFNPSGRDIVMRYPVEKAYPAAPDGTHDYVSEQAIEALKGEGVSASKVYLMPLPDGGTEKDILSGAPARYQVFYEDESGMMQQFNVPFFADVSAAQKTFEEKRQKIRDESERRMLEGLNGTDTQGIEQGAADRAMQNTVGPDWMKARAAETAIEQQRMMQGEQPEEPVLGGGW